MMLAGISKQCVDLRCTYWSIKAFVLKFLSICLEIVVCKILITMKRCSFSYLFNTVHLHIDHLVWFSKQLEKKSFLKKYIMHLFYVPLSMLELLKWQDFCRQCIEPLGLRCHCFVSFSRRRSSGVSSWTRAFSASLAANLSTSFNCLALALAASFLLPQAQCVQGLGDVAFPVRTFGWLLLQLSWSPLALDVWELCQRE